MRSSSIFLILLTYFIHPTPSLAREVCASVVFDGPKSIKFTEMEQRLLCGDDSKYGAEAAAWSNIPPAQAKRQMGALLQARGYNRPSFEIKGDVLHVRVGEPTLVAKILLLHAPPEIQIERKRQIVGRPLTPESLNDLEQWLDRELRFSGYGCPSLQTRADGDTGIVTVDIDSGPQQRIVSVDVNDNLGLVPGVLRRYDAFHIGDIFTSRDIDLTASRIVGKDVLSNTNFLTECKTDGVHVHQKVFGGPPRTFRFGFGLDTEQIVISRVGWRHNRLDNHGSILEANLQASFRLQKLTGNLYQFFSDNPRAYVKPTVEVSHDKERDTEVTSLSFGGYYGITEDTADKSWMTELGPIMEYDNTLVGPGPGSSRNLLIKGQGLLETHNFEFFLGSPRTGFRTSASMILSSRNEFSQVSAQKFTLLTEHLWNWQHYDPPTVIAGIRFGAAVTNTDLSLSDGMLPTIFRNYLGGSTDVRGFNRLELPSSGTGALTTAFASFEFRFNSLLPANIQPFVFYDVGLLGMTSFTLSYPVYTSPGIGIRWDSPIGVFRVTLAHGYVWSPDVATDPNLSHYQAFLSYGEEF